MSTFTDGSGTPSTLRLRCRRTRSSRIPPAMPAAPVTAGITIRVTELPPELRLVLRAGDFDAARAVVRCAPLLRARVEPLLLPLEREAADEPLLDDAERRLDDDRLEDDRLADARLVVAAISLHLLLEG